MENADYDLDGKCNVRTLKGEPGFDIKARFDLIDGDA